MFFLVDLVLKMSNISNWVEKKSTLHTPYNTSTTLLPKNTAAIIENAKHTSEKGKDIQNSLTIICWSYMLNLKMFHCGNLSIIMSPSTHLGSNPLFYSGSLVGSGHSGQGERWSGSDWRCRGRRWTELTRADESHDSRARPKSGAPEGGHPWWRPWSGAKNQRQALPVRTVYCSFTSSPQHGTMCYFCSFH